MKTTVSLPDDLFEDAERLAKRLGKPRSQMYSDAVRDYVARHEPEFVRTKLDEVLDAIRPKTDAFVAASARHALERVDW